VRHEDSGEPARARLQKSYTRRRKSRQATLSQSAVKRVTAVIAPFARDDNLFAFFRKPFSFFGGSSRIHAGEERFSAPKKPRIW